MYCHNHDFQIGNLAVAERNETYRNKIKGQMFHAYRRQDFKECASDDANVEPALTRFFLIGPLTLCVYLSCFLLGLLLGQWPNLNNQ